MSYTGLPSGLNQKMTVLQLNLGNIPHTSGHVDVTLSVAQTVGNDVRVTQAPGPYTNKGTLPDEAEMDGIIACGKIITPTIMRVYWNTTSPVKGYFKFTFNINI